ncbi:hypothetical protein Bca52824_072139 [Brassica carinata]|uniref:Reverse transcriptase zinc-binding domain-containing protein n=1 Tax=Brassica carinata TaxID=52824 RepID=A0A8X7QAF8_BRACI|nr:hypothetical protein Bca52824_072139 [Brassica carinata]
MIQSILPQHVPEILRIKPSITGAEDSYVWLASSSGVYSAKSGYYVATAMEIIDSTANQNYYKAIWRCKTSPKLHLFLWKIAQGALALGENLAKRGLVSNVTCRHCGELETAEHIFLHCHFTSIWSLQIWSSSFSPADCASFSEAFPGSSLLTLLPPWGLTGNIFPWVVWRIWTAKNYLIFENRAWTPLEILTKAVSNAKEWHLAQISTTQPRSSMSLSSNPPLQTTSLGMWVDLHHRTGRAVPPGYCYI